MEGGDGYPVAAIKKRVLKITLLALLLSSTLFATVIGLAVALIFKSVAIGILLFVPSYALSLCVYGTYMDIKKG